MRNADELIMLRLCGRAERKEITEQEARILFRARCPHVLLSRSGFNTAIRLMVFLYRSGLYNITTGPDGVETLKHIK